MSVNLACVCHPPRDPSIDESTGELAIASLTSLVPWESCLVPWVTFVIPPSDVGRGFGEIFGNLLCLLLLCIASRGTAGKYQRTVFGIRVQQSDGHMTLIRVAQILALRVLFAGRVC